MANLNVKTTFNTRLNFSAETLARRIVAFLIDVIVMFLYLYLVEKLLSQFDFNLNGNARDDQGRVTHGLYALLWLPVMFYTLISEVLSGGYTIGKRAVGIKVVKIDGFQPGFVEFFVRWIFRVVDIYFLVLVLILTQSVSSWMSIWLVGIIGIFAIVRSKKGQRIGDTVAGTTVIRSKQKENINITILKELSQDYKPKYTQVMVLSDNDARIIKETFEIAVRTRNDDLIGQLVSKLESIMKIQNNDPPRQFVERVLKDFNFYTQNL